jgi:hypothetical protein
MGEEKALLEEQECIVGATGWCRRMIGGEVREHRDLHP